MNKPSSNSSNRKSAFQALRFKEMDYIRYDPFEGPGDSVVTCRSVKLVLAKKEWPCFQGTGQFGDGHTIKPGDLYRSEKALVDYSHWGNYAVCIPCMDQWLNNVLGEHHVQVKNRE